jgi:hypothetical protein
MNDTPRVAADASESPGTPSAGTTALTDPLETLNSLSGSGGADADDFPAATHWPSLPAVDAEEAWADLRTWVDELQDRFSHLDHHVIPACWWLHNEHVEALCALRDHEQVSYAEAAPASAPVDWLRALRDITDLLRTFTRELSCAAAHQDPHPRLRSTNGEDWRDFVAADVARRHQAAIDGAVGQHNR